MDVGKDIQQRDAEERGTKTVSWEEDDEHEEREDECEEEREEG